MYTALFQILEKVLYSRVALHICKNKVLTRCQFGFQKGYSTENAVYVVTDEILNTMNNQTSPIGSFCDLSKAFDFVNHAFLLHKFKYCDTSVTWQKLFDSYLTVRVQNMKRNISILHENQIICEIVIFQEQISHRVWSSVLCSSLAILCLQRCKTCFSWQYMYSNNT